MLVEAVLQCQNPAAVFQIALQKKNVVMYDILSKIENWFASGQSVALATVVQTDPPVHCWLGAKLAANQAGDLVGWLGLGEVELLVLPALQALLQTGTPPELMHCPTAYGSILVFIQRIDQTIFESLSNDIDNAEAVAMATLVQAPPELLGQSLLWATNKRQTGKYHNDLSTTLLQLTQNQLASGETALVSLPTASNQQQLLVFIDILRPAPTLVVVGGVPLAQLLLKMAATLQWRLVLIEPRTLLARADLYPANTTLIMAWPSTALKPFLNHPRTAIICLTNDPKLQSATLVLAQQSSAFYIGSLPAHPRAGITGPLIDWSVVNTVPQYGCQQSVALRLLAEVQQASTQTQLASAEK